MLRIGSVRAQLFALVAVSTVPWIVLIPLDPATPWLALLVAMPAVACALVFASRIGREFRRFEEAADEKRRAEDELRESEQRYRYLFESNPHPMWVYDVNTLEFLAVNQSAIDSYGYTQADFDSMTIADIRPAEDIARLERALVPIRNQVLSRGEWRHRKKDGTIIEVEIISHAFRFGERAARLVLANDITDRMRATEALAAERNLLRAVIDNLPDHIYTKDREGRYVINSAGHLRLFRLAHEQVAGKTVFDFFPPEVAKRMHADDRSVLDSGTALFDRELQVVDADGTQRWHLITKVPLHNASGEVTGLVGISRDITEQRRAERALRASEHQLRLVTENIPAMIAYHDSKLVCRYANRRYDQFYGLSPGTAVGKPQVEILGAEGYNAAFPYLQKLLAGKPVEYHRTHVSRDGTAREIDVIGIPDRTDAGNVAGFYVLVQDITERRKTEHALRDSEERLRTVADNVPALIGYVDAELRYQYVNKTYEDWYGMPTEAYIGRRMEEIVGKEIYSSLKPLLDAALRGEIATTERRTRARDERYARFTYAPHFDEDGRVRGFYVLGYDITERRKAEEALRKLNVELEDRVRERTAQLANANQELEAFSYSVSHDLRAPLRSIDGFSLALLEDYGGTLDEQGQDFLQRIRKSSQRMAQLIDDLLALSHVIRAELHRTHVDLTALAQEIAAEIAKSDPARKVEFAIESGLGATADRNLMRVVLENLLGNAWKFSAKAPAAKIEFGCTLEGGQGVFHVRDNGAGFDMTYAGRLFGAFQRLHDAREFPGSGIGLATVKRIVRRHGGEVWAEGTPGAGASFYFTLEQPALRDGRGAVIKATSSERA